MSREMLLPPDTAAQLQHTDTAAQLQHIREKLGTCRWEEDAQHIKTLVNQVAEHSNTFGTLLFQHQTQRLVKKAETFTSTLEKRPTGTDDNNSESCFGFACFGGEPHVASHAHGHGLMVEVLSLEAMIADVRDPLFSSANCFWLLQTYSIIMTLILCVNLFVGTTFSMFLVLMSHLTDTTYELGIGTRCAARAFFVILPCTLFGGALFVSSCWRLLVRQISGVSFARCRALMVRGVLPRRWTVEAQGSDPDPKLETAIEYVDLWFDEVFLTFCVMGAALITGFKVHELVLEDALNRSFACFFSIVTSLWGGAMFGDCVWGFFTSLGYAVSEMKAERQDAGRDTRCSQIRQMAAAISKHSIKPGEMKVKMPVVQQWLDVQVVDAADQHENDYWNRIMNLLPIGCLTNLMQPATWTLLWKQFKKDWATQHTYFRMKRPHIARCLNNPAIKMLIAIGVFIAPPLCFILSTAAQTQEWWLLGASLWIIGFMFVLALFFYNHFPTVLTPNFFIGVIFIAIVVDAVLCAGLRIEPLFHGKPIATPLPGHHDGVQEPWIFDRSVPGAQSLPPPYPACNIRYGAHGELRVLDLALLCGYSYDPDELSYHEGGDVWTTASFSFSDGITEVEVKEAQDYWKVGRIVVFRFTTAGSSRGTTVLVVKGSSEPFDFYVDASLWSWIASFQIFMVFVPILNQLPNQVFAGLLWMAKRTDIEKKIFTNVHHVYRKYKDLYPDDVVLGTGHSLGGGIVTAAGGSLGIHTVAFSGPGSHFSRWRFNTNIERGQRLGLDIKPALDIVHTVDRHDEMGQRIQCRGPTGKKRDSGTCHQIGTTTCELWRACGDDRRRDFRLMCEALLGVDYLQGAYFTDL